MSTRSCIALCLALVLLLSGCLPSWQVTQAFTLNPDGSGKLVFDVSTNGNIDPNPLAGGSEGDESEDPAEIARQTVQKAFKESSGLDALAELSYDVLKDGRIRIKGVAYFPNCSKMQLPWTKGAEFFTVGPKGLQVGSDSSETPASQPASQPTEQLTEEAKARKLLHARMGYQRMRPVLVAAFDGTKSDVTFYVPAKVESPGLFKLTPRGGLRYVIDGRKMIAIMDAAMMDDDLAAGVAGSLDPKALKQRDKYLELMHGPGPYAPLKITLNDKPLFDYKSEMAKARQAMPEMLKKLKLDLAPSVFEPKPDEPEALFEEKSSPKLDF